MQRGSANLIAFCLLLECSSSAAKLNQFLTPALHDVGALLTSTTTRHSLTFDLRRRSCCHTLRSSGSAPTTHQVPTYIARNTSVADTSPVRPAIATLSNTAGNAATAKATSGRLSDAQGHDHPKTCLTSTN